MIGTLSGQVESVLNDVVVLDVHGVGYELRMPSADVMTLRIGEQVKVFTALNVSQDAITLYGFIGEEEKRMFLSLQKVSGIGPRVALSLLATLPPDRLAQAVTQGDAAALSKAPGLGRKGAQKIILELSGKLNMSPKDQGGRMSTGFDEGMLKVIEGLQSLGWHEEDAAHAVEVVCREQGYGEHLKEVDIPKVLKAALSSLDRGL
ncbi:Holliday junction branch migration protein RuvA [Bifidobacterium bombi]|uniref:Holliday junction branch migration complex subunit RuvA n=1 Tax=Bifidobacterium bombi DSM 19703 TaxID=1341695 RepID=A0A080N2X1_9BIFI|nr:Holliday junction branch migration protein RuvA [Bifidobacterium bombi]KFF31241.1 holliday junction ATP-dependent DNA helicase ruvA [Bifidobacterium bombi DSM 19703]